MKHTWNISLILQENDPQVIKEEIQATRDIAEDFIAKWQNRTDYTENPEAMREALDEYESLARDHGVYERVLYFYLLQKQLDQTNTEIKAAFNKIYDQVIVLHNRLEFFTLRLSKIDTKKQSDFLTAEILEPYRHFLERLFTSGKHTLSEAEERILNVMSKVSSGNWVDMVNELIAKQTREVLTESGDKEEKSFADIMELMSSKKEEVRDEAARAVNDIITNYIEVGEHEINAVLEKKTITDQLRSFERPDEARHLGDDVTAEVVDTLVSVVSDAFPIAQEYYTIKAKLLGKEKLQYHERNVPIGELDTTYSFEDAYELVADVFGDLDPEFESVYRSFFEQGQVDVFPKKGKANGAFCIHMLPTTPIYVLLNYTNKLSNVRVIAHEFGHALHSYFSSKVQNALQFDYPTSTAECASTFFEDFVTQRLASQLDKEHTLTLHMMKLNDEISSVFRQIAFYNFERELHETRRAEGYVSSERIGEIFQKHMVSYMGDAVSQDEGSENWWLYVGHFRRPFYVYSYAFGLLISKALQRMVKQDPKSTAQVKAFLSSGGSASPQEIFNELGIDITSRSFWEQGIQEIRDLVEEVKTLI